MEKYMKPEMEVEFFLADVITESGPTGCGAADDELPIIPGAELGEPESAGDFD